MYYKMENSPQSLIKEYVTLDGLQNWLKHEYEHLGWMALMLANGYPEKAFAYSMSLERLENAIRERMSMETKCAHTKRDLEVLLYKLDKLKLFSEKLGITKALKEKVCAETMVQEAVQEQKGGAKKNVKRGSKKGSKKGSKTTRTNKKM